MFSTTIHRAARGALLAGGVTLALAAGIACAEEDADPTATATASPTATATATMTATATATASATGTPEAGVPDAPTDVVISGRIPDLNTPVPEGEGESGRISITWTAVEGDVEGYRIYQEACEADVEAVLEVTAEETTYGPLNPCRPARVGVAAFNAAGESEIVWGDPEE